MAVSGPAKISLPQHLHYKVNKAKAVYKNHYKRKLKKIGVRLIVSK